MAIRYGKALGPLAAVGAATLISACTVQVPNGLPASSGVQVNVSSAPAPAGAAQNSGGSSGQGNGSQSGAQLSGDSDSTASTSTNQVAQNVFVSSYNPDTGQGVRLLRKPAEFLPQNITGLAPAHEEAQNIHWARWDKDKAVGNCSLLITGGGADPQRVDHVRITLSNVRNKNGVLQYTHFKYDYPDNRFGKSTDERDIDITNP